jgi:LSU ribosomal protein L24P
VATTKIKKGDNVKVITGKDKGKEGKVLAIKDGKVIVEGVNMVSKHTKPNQANPKGGIIKQEAPIDISNVMYVHKGKVTRIGFKFIEDKNGNKKKVRIAKTTGEVID